MEPLPDDDFAPDHLRRPGGGQRFLRLVGDDERPSEPRPGRAALRGAAAGFLVVALLVVALATASGVQASSAVALGVFTGAFGGCGFGGMLGASLALMRTYD